MSEKPLIAYVTCPTREVANQIAYDLVEKHYAACVNIIPGLVSTYRWNNEIHQDAEWLLMIKTTPAAFNRLQAAVVARHPDELPEVIAVEICRGLPGYLQWIDQEVTPG